MVFHERRSGSHFDCDLLACMNEMKNDQVRKMLEDYKPSDPSLALSNLANSSGQTLLHYAAEFGNVEIVQLLIELGCAVDAQNKFGNTPLIFAAYNDDKPVVEVLLKAGADVFHTNKEGKNALKEILETNLDSPEMLEILVNHGLLNDKHKGMTADSFVKKLCEYGVTLNQFAGMKNVKFIKLLLDNGYAVNEKDCSQYTTPTALHFAVKMNNLNMVKILVDYGANIEALDATDSIPLRYLYANETNDNSRERLEILKILLTRATFLTTCYADGYMQIYYALIYGCREAVELVLKSINNLNTSDETSDTSVHYLAYNRNEGVIEVLRNRNFDVNARNDNGETPLHVAVTRILPDTVKFLLKKRADVSAKDNFDLTPLCKLFQSFGAPVEDTKKCIRLLLEYGVDPSDDLHRSIFEDQEEVTSDESTLLEPIIAHLAIGRARGIEIPKYHLSKIVENLAWNKYFDLCEKEVDRLRKTKIDVKITVFDFLTGNEKETLVYSRNEEFVAKLKKIVEKFELDSPYYELLRHRFGKAMQLADLQKKANNSICKLHSVKDNAHFFTPEYVVDHLSIQDMKNLNNVQ